MKVPLLDLRQQHQTLRQEIFAAIEQVLDSQQFVMGPEVKKLEEEMAAYIGVKHAIGCASGSDAVLLALMALDLKPDDEVVTSAFTFFATGSAIARLGARPVFVDIDPKSYNVDVEKIEAAITSRTRAIIPVHIYGQCADMEPIEGISRKHGVPLVEDAAQAIGAMDKDRQAGTIGSIGCFSFYPSKNLGAAGDAGMVITNDDALAERLKTLRVHGAATEYHHREIGINSRLDSLQATVLRVKLKHLAAWSESRRQKARRYAELFEQAELSIKIVPPFVRKDGSHIFHQYVIRVPLHRDALMKHLIENGISTRVYYPVPLHLQECFAYLGYREGDLPETESATLETMALPCFPELKDEEQQYVVETIASFRP